MSKQQPRISHSNIHLLSWLRPRQHVSGYLWIRYFFFPGGASVRTYPVNPACESATFWIRSPEWRTRVDPKSGYFFMQWCNKIEQVLYLEYCILNCIQEGNFDASSLANISRRVQGNIREWIRIRVGYLWTGKFDLNTVTCGRGNFFNPERKSCGFKIFGYVWTGPKQSPPWKEIQDSLRFWISWRGFRIPGNGLWILCQWNMESGFQFLGSSALVEFRIPKPRITDSTGKHFPCCIGRIQYFTMFQVPDHYLSHFFIPFER